MCNRVERSSYYTYHLLWHLNSPNCAHSVLRFAHDLQYTVSAHVNSAKWLVFLLETEIVNCAVGIGNFKYFTLCITVWFRRTDVFGLQTELQTVYRIIKQSI
jgi:hypothetical protein